MTFWVDVALISVLALVLWAWLTWRLLEWFEWEIWGGQYEGVIEAQPDRARRKPGGRAEAEIPVGGMYCSACERTLAVALGHLEGVREVDADHRGERVRVGYDPDRVDERRLREQIEGCGFRPL